MWDRGSSVARVAADAPGTRGRFRTCGIAVRTDPGWSTDLPGTRSLEHCRLAIIDPDNREADQPFADPTGRWTIVYNGELFNYRELRRDLERRGVRFRTKSDTEVVLKRSSPTVRPRSRALPRHVRVRALGCGRARAASPPATRSASSRSTTRSPTASSSPPASCARSSRTRRCARRSIPRASSSTSPSASSSGDRDAARRDLQAPGRALAARHGRGGRRSPSTGTPLPRATPGASRTRSRELLERLDARSRLRW